MIHVVLLTRGTSAHSVEAEWNALRAESSISRWSWVWAQKGPITSAHSSHILMGQEFTHRSGRNTHIQQVITGKKNKKHTNKPPFQWRTLNPWLTCVNSMIHKWIFLRGDDVFFHRHLKVKRAEPSRLLQSPNAIKVPQSPYASSTCVGSVAVPQLL